VLVDSVRLARLAEVSVASFRLIRLAELLIDSVRLVKLAELLVGSVRLARVVELFIAIVELTMLVETDRPSTAVESNRRFTNPNIFKFYGFDRHKFPRDQENESAYIVFPSIHLRLIRVLLSTSWRKGTAFLLDKE